MDSRTRLAEADWLIPSKIAPFPCPGGVIERPRLTCGLLGARPRRLTLVMAPPGYGKTTLVTQWSARLRGAGFGIGWLNLDEDDDEPTTFLSYLAASLESIGVEARPLAVSLQQASRPLSVKSALGALVQAMDRHEGRMLLVMEDVHRVRDARVRGLIDTLLERLPPGMHVCMTARARPALKLAAPYARGEMTLLAAEDLSFTVEEASAFFGSALSLAAASQLKQACEGWPIALQLIKLHLGRGERLPASATFVGGRSELAAYLAEQVLASLPDSLRDALFRTSVLERMSAPLIDHLTGRRDGLAILDALQSENLFVTPLDEQAIWFRYHPLFAEFLRGRAERADPRLLESAHRAAAEWFLAHGLLRDAVRHACACRDPRLVGSMLEGAGGWRAILRGGPSLLRVFSELPDPIVRGSPRLRLGQIFAMLRDGHVAEGQRAFAALIASGGGIESECFREIRGDLLMIDLLLKAHTSDPVTEQSLGEIESRMREMTREASASRPIILEMNALFLYWAGQFDRAFDRAESASRACEGADLPFIQVYSQMFAALSLMERGNFDGALERLSRTAELAADLCGAGDDRVLAPKVFIAELALDRGDDGPAREVAAQLDAIEEGEGWFDLFRSAFAVAIAAADEAQVWILLRRAERLSQRDELRRLAGFSGAAALRRAAAAGDGAQADALFEYPPLRQLLGAEPQDWRGETEALLAAVDHALLMGELREAEALLQRVETGARTRGQSRALARAGVQRAHVMWRQGRIDAAAEALLRASELGADMGLRRPYQEHRAAVLAVMEHLRRGRKQAAGRAGRFLSELCDRLSAADDTGDAKLSPREREILQLIAAGQTSKEVARELGVSVNTIMTHRKSIYRKLNVTTRSQVINAARALGLSA